MNKFTFHWTDQSCADIALKVFKLLQHEERVDDDAEEGEEAGDPDVVDQVGVVLTRVSRDEDVDIDAVDRDEEGEDGEELDVDSEDGLGSLQGKHAGVEDRETTESWRFWNQFGHLEEHGWILSLPLNSLNSLDVIFSKLYIFNLRAWVQFLRSEEN